jgi:L-amino acid N-acyltransferase YncA
VTATIRAATPDDWPSIWPIIREVAAAGETYTYPRDIDEALARQIWSAGANGTVLVAAADGGVVGSAKVGPNQMGPGGHVATASFMVAASARGLGIGRKLGEAAIDWATTQGFRAMQFNAVVSVNAPAVALWQSLGFVIVGTVPGAFDHPTAGYVDLLVMHRSLLDG